MSRSVLLQLARDSIHEVLQIRRIINKHELLKKHPLLKQNIKTTINVYVDNEIVSSSAINADNLFDSIVLNAKKAVFEKRDGAMLISEYLSCEIEVVLEVDGETMSEKDKALVE